MNRLIAGILLIIALVTTGLLLTSLTFKITDDSTPSQHLPDNNGLSNYYKTLSLNEAGLSYSAFEQAINGFEKLKINGKVSKDIIAICDFSQSSKNNRFYVLDLSKGKLLFHTLVAHGKNSGEEFARVFSNEPESLKSSLGFFTTKDVYTGKHGLSLKLSGLEPGINDRAEDRAIVMHGADYVSPEFTSQHGRLGRSFGCPAVPYAEHESIINTLKGGACLFIYHPDKNYQLVSAVVR